MSWNWVHSPDTLEDLLGRYVQAPKGPGHIRLGSTGGNDRFVAARASHP